MCPKCHRIPFSLRHFRLCQIRPVNRDTTTSVRPDPILYLIHRPYQSLSYFTYVTLKQYKIIDKYMKWVDFNNYTFLDIDWKEYDFIYYAWKLAMTDTCMNIPCDECRQKEIDRATQHSFMKKQLYIQRARNKAISKRQAIDESQRVITQ